MGAVGTARLTEAIPADRALAAAIRRTDIADVLRDPDATPELVLRIVVPGRTEPAELSVAWQRGELERILDATDGPEVVLTFDRDQLASATSDVEAHGLRTRTAVFAVAAAGALGSGATVADAMPTADGGPVAPATTSADGGSAGILDVHQPGTADLIGGAFLLAIAGASFATRRVGTARPV